jgi:hypothetical protein
MQLTTTVGNFATGDYLTFNLPGGYFIESTDLSGCTSNSVGITITSCETTKNEAIVTIAVTVSARVLSLTLNNYVNPYSTTPVTGLRTWLRNSDGILRAYH